MNRVTYTETTGAVPTTSVICAVNFGDPYLVDTAELDANYDKTVGNTSGDMPYTALAGDSEVENSDYERSWDLKDYIVTEAANGKSRLGCVVRV